MPIYTFNVSRRNISLVMCVLALTGCDIFKSPPGSEARENAIEFYKKQNPEVAQKLKIFLRNAEHMRFSIKKEPAAPDMKAMELAAACAGQPGYALAKDSYDSWNGMVVCSMTYSGLEHKDKISKFSQDLKLLKAAAGYQSTMVNQLELSRADACKDDIAYVMGRDFKNVVINNIVCVNKNADGGDKVQAFLRQAQANQSTGLLNDEITIANACDGVLAHGMAKDSKGALSDMVVCINGYNAPPAS